MDTEGKNGDTKYVTTTNGGEMFDPIGLTGEILRTARANGTSDRAYEYLRKLAEKVGVDEDKIESFVTPTKESEMYGPAVVYYP
jgi:hypothetical protein